MANTLEPKRLPQRAHLIVGRKPQRRGDHVDLRLWPSFCSLLPACARPSRLLAQPGPLAARVLAAPTRPSAEDDQATPPAWWSRSSAQAGASAGGRHAAPTRAPAGDDRPGASSWPIADRGPPAGTRQRRRPPWQARTAPSADGSRPHGDQPAPSRGAVPANKRVLGVGLMVHETDRPACRSMRP
jgi:hypothetical protein